MLFTQLYVREYRVEVFSRSDTIICSLYNYLSQMGIEPTTTDNEANSLATASNRSSLTENKNNPSALFSFPLLPSSSPSYISA